MPIYEYHCLDCNSTFDRLRSMSKADDPIACIYCKGYNTRRAKITRFMALSRSSNAGEKAAIRGTLEACGAHCATCGRPCVTRTASDDG